MVPSKAAGRDADVTAWWWTGDGGVTEKCLRSAWRQLGVGVQCLEIVWSIHGALDP